MKKIVSMFIIFITILMTSTIVSASKLTWPETFTYDDYEPNVSWFNNAEIFGPPQIGPNQDMLLCCKSGAFLNTGNSYTKVSNGQLDEQTSYIVSETRRTGKYKLIYEDAEGNKKEEYLYMYADETAKTGVYNAYEQQYAFWENPSDAKASLGGNNGCSANSKLAGYTNGRELLTEAKTTKEYLDKWIIGDEKELKKEWDEGEDKKYLIESTDYDVVISKKSGEESIIIGPISINYPDDKVRESNLAEISDIWLEDVTKKDKSLEERKLKGAIKIYYRDASGNEVGIDKKTSTRGTEYYDISSGKEFYIEYEMPDSTKIEAAGIEVKFEFLYLSGFEETEYVGYKNTKDKGQPLMNAYAIDLWKKEVVTFYKTVVEEVFDLSLKKSIVEIDGEEINNRVTVKDVDGLHTGANWNAVYQKKYNSKHVTVGDEIVYKLTIYNEGNVPGKAKTIKDYLPEGIEFKELKNTTGYDVETNGNVITLKANSDLDDIEPFNGTNLERASKSIYIVCKVKQSAIKNITDEDRVYDLSLDLEVNEYNTADKEVTYKITIKNESSKETSTIQKIKQTLPEGIEFIPEENDGWTAIQNSDGSTYVYMEISQELGTKESTEKYLKCKVTETESKRLRTTAEIISMDKPDIDTKDWKDTVSIDVDKVVVPEEAKLILSQHITGIAKNGENMEVVQDDESTTYDETKQQFNIEKGDIIKYTIKVEDENYSGSNIVQIASILPDGLKMIPNDEDEKEELASESDNDDVTKNEYDNSDWNYNDNKENEYTIKARVNIDEEIDLYCVVTTNKQGNFKNIAEIISKHENINSTPGNVELDEYLYEKQDDDDDWCEVSTYSKNSTNVKYSNLSIAISSISDIYTEDDEERIDYTITIENSGNKDVYVKKLNTTFDGLVYREKITDEGFEISKSSSNSITLKSEDSDGVLIETGEEKEITIKCKYAAEDVYRDEEHAREDEVITMEANILEASEKGLSNINWSTEKKARYGYDYVEEETGYNVKDKNAYYEYLTNIAEITEVSGDDRDALDWRDSDTVEVKDGIVIAGEKRWEDDGYEDKRPSRIIVKLLANGEEVDSKKITEDDDWQYEFAGLRKYDDEGNKIKYTIRENVPEGYKVEYDGYDIINTYTGDPGEEYKRVTVTKEWKDEGHEDKRPSSIIIKLFADDEEKDSVILNGTGNTWSYSFNKLPIYNSSGEEINYTIKEEGTPAGYSVSYNGYKIINTYKGEETETRYTNISGTKIWKDAGHEDRRPSSITVQLLANGEVKETKEVTESDGWNYSFNNLPVYDSGGNIIEYKLKEENVPKEYTVSYSGYNITNTYGETIKLTTKLSGYVFEDIAANKSNSTNNLFDSEGADELLEGIKVTLMDYNTRAEATLYQEWEETGETEKYESEVRTNPTITDENGYYSFEGLDPLKTYYVVFEYDGVLYETVEENQNEESDTSAYKINSKALETSTDRNNKNKEFAEISVNGAIDTSGSITVNNVYSQEELVGSKAKLYSYNGITGLNIYQLITEYTKQYIENNKNSIIDANGRFDYNAMYESIKTSEEIERNDSEFEGKLDFIKSTRITASTEEAGKLYPNPDYEKYVIDTKEGTIEATSGKPKYGYEESEEAKIVKENLYENGDSSAGTLGLSTIIQNYINSIEGTTYQTITNDFYNGSRDGTDVIENFDDYISTILYSKVEPTTDPNGYNTYKTIYEAYDADNNSTTNNGYLYWLRNEVAYLMNSNKLDELGGYLDGTGYTALKELSIDVCTGESSEKYAASLEKLEGLYFVKKEKRTRGCSSSEDGHDWYTFGSWTTESITISNASKNTTEEEGYCIHGNYYTTEYQYTSTPVCVQTGDIYTVYANYDHTISQNYKFYYWRGDGSVFEDGTPNNDILANNGISTCNVLTGIYRTQIEAAVDNAVTRLNNIENSVSTKIVEEAWESAALTGIPNIYDEQFYVNLGLKEREQFDLTLAKDIYSATVSINGKTMTYNYNNVDLSTDASNWIATVRQSDVNYERNIYSSDYMSIKNGDNPQDIDITVKYRIAIKNQTANVVGKITELVDYYDKDYTYIDDSIYIADGSNSEDSKNTNIIFKNESVYESAEQNSNELNVGYIIPKNIDGSYATLDIHNGEDKFIYLEFRVTKDIDTSLLNIDGQITPEGVKEFLQEIINDEEIDSRPKTNIVEINGYQTFYEQENSTDWNSSYAYGESKLEQVAGLLDKDSSPGNYTPDGNYDTNTKRYKVYEDDEAVAGGLYLIVNYEDRRTIEGTVWEDNPDVEKLKDKIRQGDGTLEDLEKLIQNVKVELVNGDGDIQNYYDVYSGEWKNAVTYTDSDGNYRIENFIPGEYRVKFTYNNNSTNMDIGEDSSNTTYYNGQDYKSTIYAREDDESDLLWYINETVDERKSDAKDLWGDITTPETRQYVNNYSSILTNDIAETLIPTDSNKYALEETTMSALTPIMNIKVEYNKDIVQSEINKTLGQGNADDTSKYIIKNIDLGLVERPRAQLSIQKNVVNAKVILSDGTVLFDAIPDENGKFIATNVGSIPRRLATAYVETKEEKLKNSTHVSTEQGRITMNMDEELMQGANLQVTYEIEVSNIGEIDYNNENFYYYGAKITDSGIELDESNIVTTKVDQIIDYVENNMKFSNILDNQDINDGWEVKAKADMVTEVNDEKIVLKDTVIKALFNETDTVTDDADDAYNTIVVLTDEATAKDGSTYAIDDKLAPNETAKSDFILTQLISPENENDDLTYKNVLEIIKTTNDVGRRMYFSIAGNHVPVERDDSGDIVETSVRPEGREIDTDDGELITIIPPFGANMQQDTHLAILGIALITFFGAGVYLIKKKVLK